LGAVEVQAEPTEQAMVVDGWTTIRSKYRAEETTDRLEAEIRSRA